MGPNPNIAVAQGGIVVAGAAYLGIGLIVAAVGHEWLERFMPPVVTGAIVAVIGLNLAPVAVKDVSSGAFDTGFAMLTIGLVVVSAVVLPRRLRLFPILIGGGASYLLYYFACNRLGLGAPIDFSGVDSAPLLGLPRFTLPAFTWSGTALIAPVAIVLAAENLGHVRAIAAMTNRNLDPSLGRAFIADGLATVISGSFGGHGRDDLCRKYRCDKYHPELLIFHGRRGGCLRFMSRPVAKIRPSRAYHSSPHHRRPCVHFIRADYRECGPYLARRKGRFHQLSKYARRRRCHGDGRWRSHLEVRAYRIRGYRDRDVYSADSLPRDRSREGTARSLDDWRLVFGGSNGGPRCE